MKKTIINEDVLGKKETEPYTQRRKIAEDIASIYSQPEEQESSHSPSEISTLSIQRNTDRHTIDIKHGDKVVSVANKEFVEMSKQYFTALISDLETLKKQVRELSRSNSQLKSELDSVKRSKQQSVKSTRFQNMNNDEA